MAVYYCVDSRPAAGLPGEVHTTKLNDLGATREFSVDGVVNTYIYLQGIGSTVTGNYAVFDPGTYTTTLLATTSRGQIAVASAAIVASNYGWYGYIGSFSAFNLSATTSNTPLYASGTSGAGTSALTKNCQIKRAVQRGAAPTATGGAAVACSIDRPYIGSYDESV